MCKECNAEVMLKSSILGITPLRLQVLQTLVSNPGSRTPSEILKKIRLTHSINKVTLYRILDAMVEAGLVRKFSAGDRSFRYEVAGGRHVEVHPHLICKSCGEVRCLEATELFSILRSLCKLYGFRAEDIEFCVKGTCNACESEK